MSVVARGLASLLVVLLGAGCHEGTSAGPCDGVDCGHGRCVVDRVHARCDCDPWFVADGLECRLDIEGDWAVVEVLAEVVPLGSPEEEVGRGADETLHQVILTRGIAMATTEVTCAEYFDLVGGEWPCPGDLGPSCPVASLTWHEAAAYCNALSLEAGVAPCYECEGSGGERRCTALLESPYECPGFRLPTEAEWEHAARAGTTTATFAGDLDGDALGCEPSPTLAGIAWYCAEGPRPVGEGGPNGLGLFDVLGNVAEWCDETYGPYPSDPDSVEVDPWRGGEGGRVVRGGAFDDEARALRSAARASAPPSARDPGLGLRPVVTLER